MIKSANEILFHASGNGHIMSKSGKITLDVQKHLVNMFISSMYSRKEDIDSKYLHKGNECEEDSITLLSRVSKTLYSKNKQRLTDEYFTGEWDMDNLTVKNKELTETLDSKTSWSLHTFLRASFGELEPNYYWQGQTYMHLTGATKHTVAYCLVNSTASAIDQEKRYLSYKPGMMDANGNETDLFKKRASQIEINHIFDLELFRSRYPYYDFANDITKWEFDIPKEKRVKLFHVDRNQVDIDLMVEKVKDCRKWISENLMLNT